MSELAKRLRESRRIKIEAGKFVFHARRPTDIEAIGMVFHSRGEAIEAMARFIDGWEGVTEADIIPDAPETPAKFDHDLFSEWIKDRPDLWEPIVDAVLDAYTAYREEQEARGKN